MGETVDFESLGFFQKRKLLYFHPREYFRAAEIVDRNKPVHFFIFTVFIGNLVPYGIMHYFERIYAAFSSGLLAGMLTYFLYVAFDSLLTSLIVVPIFLIQIYIISIIFSILIWNKSEINRVFNLLCYSAPILILPLILGSSYVVITFNLLLKIPYERIFLGLFLGALTIYVGCVLNIAFKEKFESGYIRNIIASVLFLVPVFIEAAVLGLLISLTPLSYA